jgi:hypothetical protein
MSYWIDQKYIGMLSPQLSLFTVKSTNPYQANCRCYLCGDSQKNKTKKRAYLIQKKDKILYYCHNCGATRSVASMLKELDMSLRKEYDMEIFSDKFKANRATPKKEEVVFKYISKKDYNKPLRKLKKISSLDKEHPARKYVADRLIPEDQFHRLYYCPKFFSWANSIVPDKFKNLNKDEPRLVIPFFDKDGNMFGFQGRSFDKNVDTRYRYFSVMVSGDHTKVFGLETIDFSKTVYVTEGPLDSLFLDNCLAMAGASIDIGILDKNNTVIVMDNEKRNKDIIKQMNKYISKGWSICIWPNDLEEKDINDMVKSGKNPIDIINKNVYTGLEAKLRLSQWSKT